jgi:hypothetical protein
MDTSDNILDPSGSRLNRYRVGTKLNGKKVWFEPGAKIPSSISDVREAPPDIAAMGAEMLEQEDRAEGISEDLARRMREALEALSFVGDRDGLVKLLSNITSLHYIEGHLPTTVTREILECLEAAGLCIIPARLTLPMRSAMQDAVVRVIYGTVDDPLQKIFEAILGASPLAPPA